MPEGYLSVCVCVQGLTHAAGCGRVTLPPRRYCALSPNSPPPGPSLCRDGKVEAGPRGGKGFRREGLSKKEALGGAGRGWESGSGFSGSGLSRSG